MNFQQAVHNEELCRKLFAEGIFLDWSITAAFYSALHYSEYELFPIRLGNVEYPNFDLYYNVVKALRDNKHDARKRLVYSNIHPSAGDAYSWLKHNCWVARYYNYQRSEAEATTAIRKLEILKSYIKKASSTASEN